MTSRRTANAIRSGLICALTCSVCLASRAATSGPKTAQEFAKQYMAAFNTKNKATLAKLRLPSSVKSPMQEFVDQMVEADMKVGTQYTKFEILPVDTRKAGGMGLDGKFYKPNMPVVNVLKLSAQRKDGSSSTSFPIGVKNGIFYQVTVVPDEEMAPPFKFGWQTFTPPKSNWSVMLPNEPEPGRAALELEGGKDALSNPDIYGVVRNTAAIETTQHAFQCGEEGKRIDAKDNKATFRVACTTYEPETLKEWFSDVKKNLDDTVDLRKRSLSGELLQSKEVTLSGSPGREFEIRGQDGTNMVGRVYWIKDALYELTIEGKNKPDDVVTSKFLDSLSVQ